MNRIIAVDAKTNGSAIRIADEYEPFYVSQVIRLTVVDCIPYRMGKTIPLILTKGWTAQCVNHIEVPFRKWDHFVVVTA